MGMKRHTVGPEAFSFQGAYRGKKTYGSGVQGLNADQYYEESHEKENGQ